MARPKKLKTMDPTPTPPVLTTTEAPVAVLDRPDHVETLSDDERQALIESGAIDPELLSVALAAQLTAEPVAEMPPVPVLKTPPQVGSLPVLRRKARTHGELFDALASAASGDRAALLRDNDSPSLRWFLQLALQDTSLWVLPAGLPPFRRYEGRPFSAPTDLRREQRRLYLYLQGGNDKVADFQREKLFRNLLESLDDTEVAVLAAIKAGRIATWGLTPALVDEAFPGLRSAPFDVRFGH
jgi:hypothetical protein